MSEALATLIIILLGIGAFTWLFRTLFLGAKIADEKWKAYLNSSDNFLGLTREALKCYIERCKQDQKKS